MSPLSARNLLIFTTVSSIWAVIFGLIGPFYVVYVEQLSGGMEKLGISTSLLGDLTMKEKRGILLFFIREGED